MSQGVLPFTYELEGSQSGMTGLGGMPVYMDMIHRAGLVESITRHIGIREDSQGWTDSQVVISLVMLNLAGGEHVDDLKILQADEGFCRLLQRVEQHGVRRKERRELERRWRKEKRRSVPSPTAAFRYLSAFHDPEEEKKRVKGKAFIPSPNQYLKGLAKVNSDLISFVQHNQQHTLATLDMDATLVETSKTGASYCYKGFRSYQPLNTWWAEQGLIVHTEFRDGNVPAGYEQLRLLKESLTHLPEGVEKVRLRSDTAGYQHTLLNYCARGTSERFGRIEFAIGCDVTAAFKQAVAEVTESDWQPLYKEEHGKKIATGTEWAEVCFVPNAIGHSLKGPAYRYLAKRKLLETQQSLAGMEEALELPFPTMDIEKRRYKIFGVVTNMDWAGGALIEWHHERCGKSEEAHSVMKADLAGGKLPSGDFGENSAWWWIMILALNLNGAMKSLTMGKSWIKKRMKAVRFNIINLPGRIVEHARCLVVRIAKGHPSFNLLIEMRKRIGELAPLPT